MAVLVEGKQIYTYIYVCVCVCREREKVPRMFCVVMDDASSFTGRGGGLKENSMRLGWNWMRELERFSRRNMCRQKATSSGLDVCVS